METTLPATETLHSDQAAFSLIENFFLGRQSQSIGRILGVCHPTIEYHVEPTKPISGIALLKYAMAKILDDTDSFNFKLKLVLWDEQLSSGSAVIEYEYTNAKTKKGERVFEIAVFKTTTGLLSSYISSKTIIGTW